MLLIGGRKGKSIVLMDKFIKDGAMIIETEKANMSRMVNETCSIVQIESDSKRNIDEVVRKLIMFYNGEEYGAGDFGNTLVFYLNTKEENIGAIKKLEQMFDLKIFVTIQTDSEEIEYYIC